DSSRAARQRRGADSDRRLHAAVRRPRELARLPHRPAGPRPVRVRRKTAAASDAHGRAFGFAVLGDGGGLSLAERASKTRTRRARVVRGVPAFARRRDDSLRRRCGARVSVPSAMSAAVTVMVATLRLAIYYGYPTLVDGAGGDLDRAAAAFAR